MRPGLDPVAASVTSFLLLPNGSDPLFMGTLTSDEYVGSLTCTCGRCVRLFLFASCTSDGCVGEKSVGVNPVAGEEPC